jgi:immune inhibitor A
MFSPDRHRMFSYQEIIECGVAALLMKGALSMKHQKACFLVLSIILAHALVTPAWSMPPHPDLLQRIRNGQVQEPFFFEREEELRAQGVDTPTKVQLICDIASGTTKETFNAIAILVDFDDNTSSVNPAFFDTLLYEDQTGTLRDYWSEVTYGNLTIVTLDLPSALGWKRAPQTYEYYVDSLYGRGTYPRNARKMAEDAVVLADPFVDFSDYDNDSDGYVDALFIIHAGPGAEYTGSVNDIWSHKGSMVNPPFVDGVTAKVYSTEPEYWSHSGDMTVGVYAHEMGHSVFGLPDLYDYGYDSRGVGNWSLMAGGSWNGPVGASPAHPDAWSRIQTGSASPTVLSANLPGASIPAVQDTPAIYRLWTDGAMGDQFVLVENRQLLGYDAYLPGPGLLIYHVDEAQSNNNNQWYPGYTDDGHYLVALEQSDGQWHMEKNWNSGHGRDPYPGTLDKRTYDDSSTPDSRDYDFNTTLVAVRNVGDSGPTMTADLFVTTVSPPDAVDDLSATLVAGVKSASGDLQLTWTEPFAEGGVSYYVIYRSTVASSSGDSLDATADVQYTDLGVAGDTLTNYYYTVKAVDNFGSKSPSSNQAGEFDIYLIAGE